MTAQKNKKNEAEQRCYPHVIEVAIDVPLRKTFDYLPNGETLPVVGARVQVSFAGRKKSVGVVLAVKRNQPSPYKLKALTAVLDDKPVIAPAVMALCVWVSRYYQQPIGEVLTYALPTLLRQGKSLLDLSEARAIVTQQGREGLLHLSKRAKQQHAILTKLCQGKGKEQSCAVANLGSRASVKLLENKGWISITNQLLSPQEVSAASLYNASPLQANAAQQEAISRIEQSNGFASFLLDGVTGSGKTEVYLQAMASVLLQQKQVLILVPEIGLVPQLMQRCQQRFAVPVVCLHSQLTPKNRLTAWQKSAIGVAKIIIGTRSALLTPLPALGLLIVDEEHDTSFKQQDGIRFHARDVAITYAKQRDIAVVLGSATPSLESVHNVNQHRFTALPLPNKAQDAAKATIELVDIGDKDLFHGLHANVVLSAKNVLKNGRQVMFFLNRRGYAPIVRCQACAWEAECRQCDARLTYHKKSQKLMCHQCGVSQLIPKKCPSCFEEKVQPLGEGTEQIEEALNKALQDWPIIRIDSDAIHSASGFKKQLAPVLNAEPCVLLGTQMLTKGHHFPLLDLVVVINADGALFSADFRSQEHLLQQLMQVSGRTGRESHGQVLIQTRYPEHPVFHALHDNNYAEYARTLLDERQQMLMPPFVFSAIIRAEHKNMQAAFDFCQQIETTAQHWVEVNNYDVQVLGPAPAIMMRVKNEHRFQLLLLSPSRQDLHRLLTPLCAYIETLTLPIKRWQINVDPLSFI